MKKICLLFLICITMIISCKDKKTNKKNYTMKFATFSAPQDNHPSYSPYKIFADKVAELSNGEIEVKFFPSGQLGSPESTLLQTKQNLIQGTEASEGALAPMYKNISLFSIPYLFLNRQIAWKFLDSQFVESKINNDFATQTGLRPLAWLENGGFRHFSNNKKQIKTPENMKGLKIRVQNSPIYINIVKDLGASPTPIAWAELYTSLQTKVIDGQENAIPTFLFAKLEEVQNYLVLDAHVYSYSAILINEEFFKSLPTHLQEVVRKAARLAAISSRELSILQEEKGLKYLQNHDDFHIYTPSEEEKKMFRLASQESSTEWVKENIDTPSLVDESLEYIKTLEAK